MIVQIQTKCWVNLDQMTSFRVDEDGDYILDLVDDAGVLIEPEYQQKFLDAVNKFNAQY